MLRLSGIIKICEIKTNVLDKEEFVEVTFSQM